MGNCCCAHDTGNGSSSDTESLGEVSSKKIEQDEGYMNKKELSENPKMNMQLPGYIQGYLTINDINARITASSATQYVDLKDVKLRFAYVSQRGYYPESLNKPNQDSLICMPNFSGNPEYAFFGVFDGHGNHGDLCANFTKDLLPSKISAKINKNYDINIQNILESSHVEVDEELHISNIDDSMSGTTAISVLFLRSEIHVCNVGDSRAIIGELSDQEKKRPYLTIVAKPLSVDQTPFRRDERERVKKCGARVMTVDQIEGIEPIHENWGLQLGDEIDETGDPPRIWHPYGDYPGTAFTRSIGDKVSKSLGVCATPEILSVSLTNDTKYIVIASDGVFEFLTSQQVIDMVNYFDDPLKACHAIVQESYNRWLQHEVRTDDISIICIFVDEIVPERPSYASSLGNNILRLEEMQRPVRAVGTKGEGGRDTIVNLEEIRISSNSISAVDSDDEGLSFNSDEFTDDTSKGIEALKEIVKNDFLFNRLPERKLVEVLGSMKKEYCKAGSVIIKQGDPGEKFYIVESGAFEVRVKTKLPEAQQNVTSNEDISVYGGIVHTYNAYQGVHPTFGDLALLYSRPRAATVIAISDGIIWSLQRDTFRKILARGPHRNKVKTLSHIQLLKCMSSAQLQHLSNETIEIIFNKGELIIEENEKVNAMYIIVKGKVKRCSETSEDELGENDYFGEEALSLATVNSMFSFIALEKTICFAITQVVIESTVGNLSRIIENDGSRKKRKLKIKNLRKKRNSYTEFLHFAHSSPDTISIHSMKALSVISFDTINSLRLVVHASTSESGTNQTFFTMRSTKKICIVEQARWKTLETEQDIQYLLDSSCDIVSSIFMINNGQSHISFLYQEVIVGSLFNFTSGKIHSEDFVRFYTRQVAIGLNYLHSFGIVLRSICTENLMIDSNGKLKILDLRDAKEIGRGKAFTLCGAPDYKSPEEVHGSGHTICSDFWSLGILLFELLQGYPPFRVKTNDDMDVFKNISNFCKGSLKFPEPLSDSAKDLINNLLDPNPYTRLGYRDAFHLDEVSYLSDVLNHEFFSAVHYDGLEAPLKDNAKKELEKMMNEVPVEIFLNEVPFVDTNNIFKNF